MLVMNRGLFEQTARTIEGLTEKADRYTKESQGCDRTTTQGQLSAENLMGRANGTREAAHALQDILIKVAKADNDTSP